MHEVSLMYGIREIVEESARVHALSRVLRVKVVVGSSRLVLPEALRFAFEHLKREPLTPDAVLEIEERAGRDLFVDYLEGEP